MGARPSSFATVEAAPEAVSTRVWSGQQQDIFHWFKDGTGHLVVTARAGAAKTTTMIEALQHAPERRILITAFNTRITDELKDRTAGDRRVTACSLHAIGSRAICDSKLWMRAQLAKEGQRSEALTALVCEKTVPDSARKVISRIHNEARAIWPHVTSAEELYPMALNKGFEHPQFPTMTLCEYAFQALVECVKPMKWYDFNDMIGLALRGGLIRPKFDLVVVDECQDMSEPQLEIVQLSLAPGGRLVAVGDDRQAIYSFRGADVHALSRLKLELDATELRLSTTYRCGKRIVAEARIIVPDIEAWSEAPQGIVKVADKDELLTLAQPGDFILSRLNAPLTRIAMSLLRAGRHARVQGKDIGVTLMGLCDRFAEYGRVASLNGWRQNLEAWRAKQVKKADDADLQQQVAFINDQADTLLVLAEGDAIQTVEHIKDRIDYLFSDELDDDQFIICSTIHKAKGLEADNVFILADTLAMRVVCQCGHRHKLDADKKLTCPRCHCEEYVPDAAALAEEANIKYVAITRAKQSLTWITEGN